MSIASVLHDWRGQISWGRVCAAVALVVDAIESALTKALKILAQWDGQKNTDEIRIELNRDFIDTTLTPEEITAYLATYQGGGMSLDSFLALLVSGETLPAGRTVEDEKALIDAEGQANMVPFVKAAPAPASTVPPKAKPAARTEV